MKIFAAIASLVFSMAAWAGPFGLEMGMNKAQVENVVGKLFQPDGMPSSLNSTFISESFPGHPDFKVYVFVIDPELGLAKIFLRSDEIKSDDYGTQIKRSFNIVSDQLKSKYGKDLFREFNHNNNRLFTRPDQWSMTLYLKDRVLLNAWKPKTDNIDLLVLEAESNRPGSARLNLSYEFSNFDAVSAKRHKTEASKL